MVIPLTRKPAFLSVSSQLVVVGRAHNETVAEAAGIVITKKENGSSFIIHIQPLLMCPYSSYFPGAAYLPPPFV